MAFLVGWISKPFLASMAARQEGLFIFRGERMAKNKRKNLSKKVRFDVFKRDGFKCAYCGRATPAVVLEVDHIEPVADGGTNEKENLITSCKDCNQGKGKTPLNKIPSPLVEHIDEIKEKEEQIAHYRKVIKEKKRRIKSETLIIENIFKETFTEYSLKTQFKHRTIKKFLELLPCEEVEDAMEIATDRMTTPESCTKYFCGICWNKIKGNDKNYKVVKLWTDLTQKYGRGSGYYCKDDIDAVVNYSEDTAKACMEKALSKRRHNYWEAFMGILRGKHNE
jgi:hypothetical protein